MTPSFMIQGPVIDIFNGAVTIVNKSMLTKTIPQAELGKSNLFNDILCKFNAVLFS